MRNPKKHIPLLFAFVFLAIISHAQAPIVPIIIGTGTSTTPNAPSHRGYQYSTWEGIYLQASIATAGTITAIQFYKSAVDGGLNLENVTVYMKHTASTTVSSGAFSTAGYTTVFTGTITNSSAAGWKIITLTTPFVYNNTSNLQIAVDRGYQTIDASPPSWRYTASGTTSRRCFADGSPCASLSANTARPNIGLFINTCAAVPGTASASPTVVGHCQNATATLAGYTGTIDWQYSYDNAVWTNSGVTTASYVIPIAQTTYVRASVTNGGCTSYSNVITFSYTAVTASASPSSVINGNTTSLSVSAYYGSPALQWQSSPDNSTWTDVPGALSNPYTTAALTTSTYYRLKLTDGCGAYYSSSVFVIVYRQYFVNDGTFGAGDWCTAAGNDANSGLAANLPKATIQDVFNDYDLAPNDIIYVDKGNYTQLTTINVAADGGDATGYVSIIGKSRYTTVITAPATSHIFDIASVNYIKISNMQLVSTQAAYYDINLSGTTGSCLIDNCIMTSTGTCVRLSGSGTYSRFQNCKITSTGGTTYCAIYHSDCDYVSYYKDTITANHYGFKFDDPSSQPNYNSIKQCVVNVVNNTQTDGASIWLQHSDFDTISRNKISGGYNGIFINTDSDDPMINNNYIYGTIRGITCNNVFSENFRILHNSFYTSGSCIRLTTLETSIMPGWTVKNNILYSTAGAAGEPIIFAEPTISFMDLSFGNGIDYNLYWGPNGARTGMFISTYYSTLTNWQGVDHNSSGTGNGDANSLNFDPTYTTPASGALELTGTRRTGQNLISSIPVDIYGTARTIPVIGAWEAPYVNLPVELLYFNGRCNGGVMSLAWKTASEENSSHFIVERSINGKDFIPVKTISAAGWSSTDKSYSFDEVIEEKSDAVYYYRLIQVDFDGSTYDKATISVNSCMEPKGFTAQIFPNPTDGEITAVVNTEEKCFLSVDIVDARGRSVQDNQFKLEEGAQSIPLSLKGFSAGAYTMNFVVNGRVVASEKLIKK